MKRIIVLLSLLFIAGCATPAPASPTDDPYVGLALAEAEAARYEAQLTGTAQAFGMQVTGWTVTAQSWTPTASMTPAPTATPTVNATGTLAVARMEAEIADMEREARRKDATNAALAWAPFVALAFALGLAVFLGYVFARRLAMMPTPVHDGTGKPVPMLNVVDGTWSDIDRSANGSTGVNRRSMSALPPISAERQEAVTARAQMSSEALRRLRQTQRTRQLPEPTEQAEARLEAGLFPLPSWDLVNGWQGERHLLPYGLTERGLGFVNVSRFPHWAALGMTGMGKSRRFLRPMIACALAAGHRVVIVGKMTDYGVFREHPNAVLAHVNQMTRPEHAEYYGAILLALLGEMERRDEYLMQSGFSTWSHAGRENTFVVLDEVQNAIRLMRVARSANADRVQMGVEGLVSEGRKIGFNVAIAGQRATGMAGILSQTGKAIFRVEREEENAHKSLSGASGLQDGYFYARFGDVRLAGAFEPTDVEIAGFLKSRPAKPLEQDWVDGQVTDVLKGALPAAPAMESLPDGGDSADVEERIRRLAGDGLSVTRIVREVFGSGGGDAFYDRADRVRRIKNSMNTEGATG